MSAIEQVEVHPFAFEVENLGPTGAGAFGHARGGRMVVSRYAVTIKTDDGLTGEYVSQLGGSPAALAQTLMCAPHLIGRNPENRELIYDDLKRELRHYDRMGYGPLDIALWDLAGKKYGASVSALLGGYRTRLATYASTYPGQESGGGLDSPVAYAEFARHCQGLGFPGFKIHGWAAGDRRRESENLLGVRAAVGADMALMIDPLCQLRTFADALYVGRACDEARYFWLEDPFRDGGVSAFAHQRLREKIKTPLLVSEHVRGLEQKAAFVLAGGTDMIHVDPEYDMGITGCMKIARFGEALGLDVQVHAAGPAQRHCMAAIRNTHFYELALIGPDMPNLAPPVYACDYSDQIEAVGADGCVGVPDGPGLGVAYDWDFIAARRTDLHAFA